MALCASLDPDPRTGRGADHRTKATAEGFGGQAEVVSSPRLPCDDQFDEQNREFAAEVARTVSGDCVEAPLIMGGEDFAFMLNSRPGPIFWSAMATFAGVHHPKYDFNDEAIPRL